MAPLTRLPSTTGAAARRLATLDADRLGAIQHYISTLWSPFECPAEFLPHLAWALSVDVWDDNWTVERKRKVIAAAPEIHRLKGTDYAVELALDAFGLTYHDIEWWEEIPIALRGTFKIDVMHTDVDEFLNEDLREQIKLAIKASKPKSRSFSLRHFMLEQAKSYVGAWAFATVHATMGATIPEPILDPVGGYVGTFLHTHVYVELGS